MAIVTQTLNQYVGTTATGVQTQVVAADMTTACEVYNQQESADPVILQCIKTGVLCVQPVPYVTFTAEPYDTTGAAAAVCKVTPAQYTVKAGTGLVFTAEAGTGWTFSKWTINGVDAEGGAVAMLTIPTSESVVAVQAVFVANP